ncbi:hypothetical protein AAWM_02271 [Aspergillus awamori]|uniref:Uncharacterized protein n=1 Tax=Aspergillus awamori TaxID=105351 RepID=A0A401KJN4_ASPAW|nr:hypothetical protein AAWM_02271 [Aspergillus awamori]
MVRFLVFTFILSKYKRFCCNENGITARQRMDIASGYEQDLAALYCNIGNQNFNFTSHHGLREEFKRIAIWVSDLSCSWILYQSINCFPNSDLTRLLFQTLRRSPRGLACIPLYLGYIVLRKWLLHGSANLILVDRHFCSSGMHYNVFSVDPLLVNDSPSRNLHAVLPNSRWKLTPIDVFDPSITDSSHTPHIVVIGNSVHGSYADYLSHLDRLNGPRELLISTHEDSLCTDNSEHLADIAAANHDRIALSFFSHHDFYPFGTTMGSEEIDSVKASMDKYSPGLSQEQTETSQELANLGAGGDDMSIFGWQHVFAETKKGVAEHLKQWTNKVNLLPFSVPS